MENLDAVLDALLELQKIDGEIRGLEKLCLSVPLEIEERRQGLDRISGESERLEAQLKELKIRENKIDLDINTIKGEVAHYEKQQMEAKSNVAYQALQREIKNAESRIDDLIEAGLPLIEEIESAEKRIEETKEEYEKAENEFKADESDLLGRKREAEEKLRGLMKVREGIVVRIPEDLRRRYQRIWDNKEGLAVVPLEENVCSGCYGQIPIQRINEIKHDNELKSCENCGRIIYYREEAHGERGN